MTFFKKIAFKCFVLATIGALQVVAFDLTNPAIFDMIGGLVDTHINEKRGQSPRELEAQFAAFDQQILTARTSQELSCVTANALVWFAPNLFVQMFKIMNTTDLVQFAQRGLDSPVVHRRLIPVLGNAHVTITELLKSPDTSHRFVEEVRCALG